MKYEKPELVVLGPASAAIEGLMKPTGVVDHAGIPSTNAYESDE
jgi:hypothetical protein